MSKCPCGKCHCMICGNQMEESKHTALLEQVETYEQALNSLGEHINYLRGIIKQLSPEMYERLMRDVQSNTKWKKENVSE